MRAITLRCRLNQITTTTNIIIINHNHNYYYYNYNIVWHYPRRKQEVLLLSGRESLDLQDDAFLVQPLSRVLDFAFEDFFLLLALLRPRFPKMERDILNRSSLILM